jgi:hypothetical protein
MDVLCDLGISACTLTDPADRGIGLNSSARLPAGKALRSGTSCRETSGGAFPNYYHFAHLFWLVWRIFLGLLAGQERLDVRHNVKDLGGGRIAAVGLPRPVEEDLLVVPADVAGGKRAVQQEPLVGEPGLRRVAPALRKKKLIQYKRII